MGARGRVPSRMGLYLHVSSSVGGRPRPYVVVVGCDLRRLSSGQSPTVAWIEDLRWCGVTVWVWARARRLGRTPVRRSREAPRPYVRAATRGLPLAAPLALALHARVSLPDGCTVGSRAPGPAGGIVHVPVLVRKGLHAAQSSGRAPKSSRSPSPSPARGPPLQVQFLPMHVRPCHVMYSFFPWHILGSSLGSRVVECHSLQQAAAVFSTLVLHPSHERREYCAAKTMTRKKKWKQTSYALDHSLGNYKV